MSLGNALRIVLNKNKKYCIQEIQVILQCIQNDDDEENNTELIIKKINEDVNDNDDNNNNNVVDGANNNKTLLLVLSAAIEQWNCYLESNNNKSKKYIKYAKGIIRILIQQYEKQCKQYLIDHLLLLLKTSTRITNEDNNNNNTDKSNTAVDSTTLTPPTSTSYKMVVYEILKLKYITIHDNNEKQRIIIELKQLSEILFRKQNYIKAIDILTFIIDELLIIKGDQPHALLLSNRAACYLQVKEFVNCINDCTNGLLILNEIQDGNVNHNNNNINSNNNKARRKDEIIFYKINKIKLHVRRASAVVDLVMNSSSSSSINNGNNNGDLKYTINNAIDDHDEALNLLNTLNDSILKTLLPLLLDLNKVNTLCNTMKLKVQADQLFRNASNNNNNNNDDGRNSMSNIHENDKVNSNNNKNNHNSNNNNNNNQRNKIFNAYNIYSSILKDVPTYISVLNNRASASLAIGKFNEAINDTSFALELLKFKEDEEGCITSSDVKKKIANDGNNNNNQQRNLVIIGYYPSKVDNMQEYNSWIVKILAKRGAAYVQLQQYQNAFNDYKICVSLDATNDMKLKQDLENVALKL